MVQVTFTHQLSSNTNKIIKQYIKTTFVKMKIKRFGNLFHRQIILNSLKVTQADFNEKKNITII